MTTEKNPIDQHLDNILKASGTTLANFETSAGALQMVVELSDEQIKAILLAAGYTIKPAAPQPPAVQPVAPVSDLNALMGLVDTYAYLRSDADICMTPEVAQELEDKAKVGRSVLLATLSAKDAAHAQQQAVSDQLIRNLEARNAGLATDLAAARQHLPAHAPAFGTVAAGKLAELQANGFAVNGVSIEKTEVTGQVTRGFVTYGGLVGWWSLGAGVQSGPVLLTDDALVEINLHVAMNEVADSDGSREIVIKHGRSIEAAVHAANQAPANLEWSKGGEITKIDERVQRSRAAFYALQKDAERYRLVRRGQHWSVIDGAGDALRAEELDVAADAVISKAAGQEGGAA